MIPATLNLTLYKGTTFGPIVFEFHDINDNIVDLTGWKVWAWAKFPASGSCKSRKLDLLPTITDATGGQVTIEWTDENTRTLREGLGTWDMILETPTADRLGPYIFGSFEIKTPDTFPAE